MSKARHKRAGGGGIGIVPETAPKAEVYSGGDSGTAREAAKSRARGGSVAKKGAMHVAGNASRHMRLDRRGRKSGGSVGADSHPMTEASKLSGGGGDSYKLDSADD
jgi:hypothetical protein